MLSQHFASSLQLGERGPDGIRFAEFTIDTTSMFVQREILATDCFIRVPNGSTPDRFRDPAGLV